VSAQFKYLFSPIRIGSLTLRNRIVFSAHLTNFAERGLPSERQAYYYAERARGGVGLIITEEHSVHPTDWPYEKLIHAYKPEVIPGYRRLTAMTHRYDAQIFAQINHNGGQAWGVYSRLPVWAPSPVPDPLFREVPKELEPEEIAEVAAGYAKVVIHVREGNFDGAELQGSHSSLIRQFLSPHSNRRTDEYGGSLENRMRFLREVIAAVRGAVGRDFVLGVRVCGDELIEDGLTLDEAVEIARRLAADGQIDYLNTSIGTATHTLFMVEGSMHVPPGYALYISSAFRRAVDLPVIGVSRIKDPIQAERALAEGHADLIGMVRAQIADAEFASKSHEGRVEDIRLCISCNQECIGRVGLNLSLGCIENPAVGSEKELGIGTLKPAARSKRVMVVGGGPAGLKAATVAARRGHHVTLYEKSEALGGQVNLVTRVPNRAEFGDLVRNLLHELAGLPAKVELGVEVTPELVMAVAPEAVVIATGAVPARPAIGGAESANVLHVTELLAGAAAGERVLIIDQAGFHEATSVAEWLADGGHRVEIVSATLYVGQDLGLTLDLDNWRRRAAGSGIRCTPDISVLSIEDRLVRAIHNYSGREVLFNDIDTVVLATPGRANDGLYFALKGRVPELHRIGDCLAPRRAHAAILEGERIGRAL
jgi:2,4-dienoyl-CoA reductase (NADPH2)